jgi:hypothetical protein
VVVLGGDGDDDARGDVQEQLVQLRAARVFGDRDGGVDVVGLQRPDVREGGGDVVRLHRGERRGDGVLGHGCSSSSGRLADRGDLEDNPRTAGLWTESGR